jgi:hypothetical protein
MPDLKTQLRSYCEHLERDYSAVTFEEIIDHRGRQRARVRPLRLRRGLAMALASAVLVLMLVGGSALLLFQGEERAPVVTTPEHSPTVTIDPQPTLAESVVGFWLAEGECGDLGGQALQLAPDGTFYSWYDWLGANPTARGSYEVDQSTLTFTNDHDQSVIAPGGSWVWDVSIDQTTGDLDVHVPAAYDLRAWDDETAAGTRCSARRVQSPTTLTAAEAGWRLPTPAELMGPWLIEDGPAGVLLFLDGDAGTYKLDLDAWTVAWIGGVCQPTNGDCGTFRILETGTIMFTSRGAGIGGGSCVAGQSWVWTDVRFTPGTPEDGSLRGIPSGLTAVVGRDDCGWGLGPDLTWLRVYPAHLYR